MCTTMRMLCVCVCVGRYFNRPTPQTEATRIPSAKPTSVQKIEASKKEKQNRAHRVPTNTQQKLK